MKRVPKQVELQKLGSLTIRLYDEPSYPDFRISEIRNYLADRIGARIHERSKLLHASGPPAVDTYAKLLAASRIISPRKLQDDEPMEIEISHERKQLVTGRISNGIVYDGFAIQNLMLDFLPREERRLEYLHIAFTNRLLATFSEEDRRYHLRTIICGYPCIISLVGLVEAPARTSAFYLARQTLAGMGLWTQPATTDDHLEYGDPRTTEVAKGYAMQCVFYAILRDPFCLDARCRLYNAHTQKEMLVAQLSFPEYCKEHSDLLTGRGVG